MNCSQFNGVISGPVIITTYATNTSGQTTWLINWNKDYTTFSHVCFIGYPLTSAPVYGQLISWTGVYPIFFKCLIQQPSNNTQNAGILYYCAYNTRGIDIRKSVFLNCNLTIQGTGTAAGQWDAQVRVEDCLIQVNNSHFNMQGVRIYSDPPSTLGGVTVNNNYISGYGGVAVVNNGSSTYPAIVQNNYIEATNIALSAGGTNQMVQSYNILFGTVVVTSVSSSATSPENKFAFKNGDISRIQGWGDYTFTGAITNQGLQINGGVNTLSPSNDIYGVTWNTPTTPTIGCAEFFDYSPVGFYSPTDRNASAITIAPGDTSRSLYLYLGATGITHTTTNLTASYTRNGQASVPITLVVQAPTGSYVSGGFCEVSAPYARGTYRLDVPNAAFGFGADDVTIFVGGANTTNGAVVTCNMQGIAGNIVHIGPFKVIADGLGSDQPLDIVQGVQAPVSVQLVDANENGVDISGATVEAKVYNAIGSLIATYSCVPVYAADGRCTFQLTTLVTNTAGVYNVTLTRTIGGNIIVFGPMKMIVRAN